MPRKARHPSIKAFKTHSHNVTKRVETNGRRIDALQKQVKALRSDLRSHTGNRRIHHRRRGGGLEELDNQPERYQNPALKAKMLRVGKEFQNLQAQISEIKNERDDLRHQVQVYDQNIHTLEEQLRTCELLRGDDLDDLM